MQRQTHCSATCEQREWLQAVDLSNASSGRLVGVHGLAQRTRIAGRRLAWRQEAELPGGEGGGSQHGMHPGHKNAVVTLPRDAV